MTNEEIAEKLKLLLHFRGNGKATDKEYQDLSDVITLIFNLNISIKITLVLAHGFEQRECQLSNGATTSEFISV